MKSFYYRTRTRKKIERQKRLSGQINWTNYERNKQKNKIESVRKSCSMGVLNKGHYAHLQKRLGLIMDRRLWITTITIVVLVTLGLASSVAGHEPEHDSTVIQALEQMVPEPEPVKEEKKVVWKDNPFNCSDSQWIRADNFECIDKASKPVAPVEKATPTATVKPVGNCHTWMVEAGVPASSMDAAYALIMRESGCNPGIFNPSSGAGGIPQALPFSKMGCSTSDPVCQIKWMIGYVNARYGGFPQALAFQLANNWY